MQLTGYENVTPENVKFTDAKGFKVKESEVLGYLTGIVYWCFHKGVIEWFVTIRPLLIICQSLFRNF